MLKKPQSPAAYTIASNSKRYKKKMPAKTAIQIPSKTAIALYCHMYPFITAVAFLRMVSSCFNHITAAYPGDNEIRKSDGF